ncbi:uncharacterized protein LOC111604261 [Drosophila hydei]|uniref:Uncharacterized protein LOC111604261 n=1 Tax=Drosophila hydei TaxID=7224 RepID=A0A6J1MLW6_DROHY|nr:uncharacterized protein LOC111604261 [Drosophila hydei]XP_023178024.1 uncharacterized protein LOC111604261 [Drosophila hydei]XP_023178025.1 uncharacterized protein LOC111604261 [Drosophila hydei]
MSYGAERAFSYLYPFIIGSSLICCITSAVAWSHWRYVLNACPDTNCGCVLHGRTTYNSFEGGNIAYCHYATYGLLLPMAFAVVLGIYHCYRMCIGKGQRKAGTTTIRQRSGDMVVVTTESELTSDGLSPYYWLPATVISVIMAIYQLIYAAIFTDGFEVTCKQYRESLLKEIQGVGNIVPVIKARLSCAAVFDFMDYLVESISYERRRYGRINTAACLYFTLILSWFTLFGWIIISVINIVNLRRTRSARV